MPISCWAKHDMFLFPLYNYAFIAFLIGCQEGMKINVYISLPCWTGVLCLRMEDTKFRVLVIIWGKRKKLGFNGVQNQLWLCFIIWKMKESKAKYWIGWNLESGTWILLMLDSIILSIWKYFKIKKCTLKMNGL